MTQTDALSVLIVDDESIVRETLTSIMSHLGHKAASANDGLAGKQALQSAKYDVAFVDIRMPGIDGMNLLKWSKQEHPGIPIIIMTGHGAKASQQEALRCGAFAFLHKPFALADIMQMIETIGALRCGRDPNVLSPEPVNGKIG